MAGSFHLIMKERLRPLLGRLSSKIGEINRRYATPRITMTRWISAALLLLRLYLVFLVLLLGYKFFQIVSTPGGGI
jgi:hypothetical protein